MHCRIYRAVSSMPIWFEVGVLQMLSLFSGVQVTALSTETSPFWGCDIVLNFSILLKRISICAYVELWELLKEFL